MSGSINKSLTFLPAIFLRLLLVVATLAVFWPATGFDFLNWDDNFFVYENRLLSVPGIDNTLRFWTGGSKGLYIPVTGTIWSLLAWLSLYMPAEPYGLNPRLFHTANIVVHILSVLVIFSILRMLLTHGFKSNEDDSHDTDTIKIDLAAGVGALIFALHPVQVETVAWISELKDLLCGLFSFVAIREYLAFAFAARNKNADGKMKYVHYLIACIAFLLALLSKPAAVIVPLVLLILDRWAVQRPLKESLKALIGWFILSGLFGVIAKMVQHSGFMVIETPLWGRPFVAGDALAFYLYKLALPLHLGTDYGRTPLYLLDQWWGYATWLLPFAVLVGILFLKRRTPFLVSLGIFAASLLPVLGFMPFIFQQQSTVADHYLYIPMLGAALCISWIFLNYKSTITGSVILVITVLLVVRSSFQLPVWKNNFTLYTSVLKINQLSVASHNNLGIIYYQRRELDNAIMHYKSALEIRRGHPESLNNLGVALKESGRLNEAAVQFRTAVKNRSSYATANYNLAIVLQKLGKFEEAAFYFKQFIKLDPYNHNSHNKLGAVLDVMGKLDEAIFHYERALKLSPNNADVHYNLSVALGKKGDWKRAGYHYKRAKQLQPTLRK